MTGRLPPAIVLLCMGVAACGRSTIEQPNNASVNDTINAISANMTEADGTSPQTVPADADSVGQSMRAAAAKRPPKP